MPDTNLEDTTAKARALAHEFVVTIVMAKWAKFGLPDTFLAEAMLAQGAVLMANAEGPAPASQLLSEMADAFAEDASAPPPVSH